ncbi:DUF2339 domain-containing protein, partial [Opitutaceae bacterium]|nr:DUF2339 domain-containing protein [Opitutaceae bacterium]
RVGESGEAQIGGWWATRIGALLAVIGVVFFGVYVSAHTAPWVRWVELVVIALGVTAAGGWLERKSLRVGPVITGAGHALLFFTAFAGYAVDPVKVVDSPWLAALLQAGAVVYIGWSGWRRNSPTTVTMGVLLGYVSAFFAVVDDFHNMAAVAGLLMATTAVVLCQRRGWRVPVYCSVVLTPLLTMARIIAERNDLDPFHLYGLVLAGFALHFSLAYLSIQRDGKLPKNWRRFQTVNISLSLLAGLVATGFVTDYVSVAGYFAGAGVILLGLTVWVALKIPGDRFEDTLAVKAASLFALAAMAHWEARTQWIALLVETVVLVAAAHRSGRNALRFTALGVWLFSLGFFAQDAIGLHRDIISPDGLAALIYVLASVVAFDFLTRQWRTASDAPTTIDWLLGALGAVPLWLVCSDSFEQSWAPLGATAFAFALGLGGLAVLRRSRTIMPSVLVAFVTAHLSIQFFNERMFESSWLWAGAIPLGIGTLAAGAWTTKRLQLSATINTARSHLLGTGLVLLGTAALTGTFLQVLSVEQALIGTAVLAVGLTSGGVRLPRPSVALGGMVSLATGSFLLLVHAPFAVDDVAGTMSMKVMALAVPVLWIIGSRHENQEAIRRGHKLVALVAVPLVFSAIGDVSAVVLAVSITAIGAVFSVIAHRCRVRAAYVASSLVGWIGLLYILGEYSMAGDAALLSLAGVTVLILAIALQPLVAKRYDAQVTPRALKVWTFVHVLVAASSITIVALDDRAVWQDYGSVLWAMGGILLFGLGIWGRSRMHRIAGLALLLFCIPRVFVHDIQEAQHRIAAFIVLGLLLLWVGFSYQKFRSFIEGSPAVDTDQEDGQP